ncbi:MAG TPA: CHASE3 domain-containing protein, partial [Gemmatimonadales bacterium]
VAAYRAQASLYGMIADLRAYLVLGEPEFISSYTAAEQDFQTHLATLEARSANLAPEDQQRLQALKERFTRWKTYPERLFALRDDQIAREPAYAWLNTEGADLAGQILINTNTLIDQLARRTPSETNNLLLRDVSQFQSSFAAMFSGLRGYVTTRNPLFRYYEFQTNLDLNNDVWPRLQSRQGDFDAPQQELLHQIDEKRRAFLAPVSQHVFAVMQSPQWRGDLYLFASEAVPLNNEMQELLDALTESQQRALAQDLSRGSASLALARRQTLIGGVVAVLLGMGLAVIFRQQIAGPIRRLTEVADQIRMGDLVVQAAVETGDEIGTLATTFNAMTGQLRQSLAQVREEKQRADNLLEVVIPIGVALSAEKDYQRLLDTILREAKAFCQADAGILYLQTHDQQLTYVIICDDTHQIALGGTSGTPIPYPPLPLYDPASGAP